MAEENKAPYVIVRHRMPEGTIRHDVRLPRYWKCKETGDTVEVRRYLHIANEMKRRVVFFDQTVGHELSADEKDFRRDFEPIGNLSDKF